MRTKRRKEIGFNGTTAPPEPLDKFLATSRLTIEQVAKLSGIDLNHLNWAIQGKVSLDEAHILRLNEAIPGLDTRGLTNNSMFTPAHHSKLDSRHLPPKCELRILPLSAVRVGYYLRHQDESGRYAWAQVSRMPDPEQLKRPHVEVESAGIDFNLPTAIRYWVAVPKDAEVER